MFRSKRRYEKQTRDQMRKQTRIMSGEDPDRVMHPHLASLADGINLARKTGAAVKKVAAAPPTLPQGEKPMPGAPGVVGFRMEAWKRSDKREIPAVLRREGIPTSTIGDVLYISAAHDPRLQAILGARKLPRESIDDEGR